MLVLSRKNGETVRVLNEDGEVLGTITVVSHRALAGLLPVRQHRTVDRRLLEIADLRCALTECLTGSRADFLSAEGLRQRLREIDMICAGKVGSIVPSGDIG